MTIAFVNGQYVNASEARISPLDRGFLFGDGVYEVIPVHKGHLIHLEEHLERLNSSLAGIRMPPTYTVAEWREILETLVQKNDGGYQWLYLQVSRGFEPVRNHRFPETVIPTVFVISYPKVLISKEEQAKGIKVMPVSDIRWKLCHIKTTARLAYVLMYQEAVDAGFDEGIIVRNGLVLEGTSSNFFMIRQGQIITPPKSRKILSGITRDKILQLAKNNHIPVKECDINETELKTADELWISSSNRGVVPVTRYQNKPIGEGLAGPLWSKMWNWYTNELDSLCEKNNISLL